MSIAGTLALATVAVGSTTPAQAANVPLVDTTGSVTTVGYTAGNAQGSAEWGLIGDVETRA